MVGGLLMLVLALSGIAACIALGDTLDLVRAPAIPLTLFLEVVLAWPLFRLAYTVGSSFPPGDVIVRHTLALAFHAISNVTNSEEAKKQIANDAQEFMNRNPWWFY